MKIWIPKNDIEDFTNKGIIKTYSKIKYSDFVEVEVDQKILNEANQKLVEIKLMLG